MFVCLCDRRSDSKHMIPTNPYLQQWGGCGPPWWRLTGVGGVGRQVWATALQEPLDVGEVDGSRAAGARAMQVRSPARPHSTSFPPPPACPHTAT